MNVKKQTHQKRNNRNNYTESIVLCCSYDPEQFAGTHTPILVIGTKLDQAQVVRENALKRSSSIAEECGADEINLVSIIFGSRLE